MKKSLIRVGLAIAVLAAGVAGAAAVGAAKNTESAQVPAAARRVPESAVSQTALRDMAEHGVTIRPVEEPRPEVKVSADQAVLQAAGSFGFVNDGTVVGVSLAHLTDELYGEQLEPDPTAPSRIEPRVSNALVWVVEFEGFTPFVSAPLDAKPSTAAAANGHMLVAVDPLTGDVVWGNQF